jgi:putative membrane protein
MAVAGVVLACAGAGAQARSYYRAYQDTPQWRQGYSDRAFARRVAQANRGEIRLGRLAMNRASDASVRDFARQMVNDHRAAQQELREMASEHGITLPSELSSEQQATYERLSNMRGSSFDRAYIAVMVRDHARAVREFEAKSNGRDSAIQDWASEKLPTLRHHRDMAIEIRNNLRDGIR